jgi:hypothetical protein
MNSYENNFLKVKLISDIPDQIEFDVYLEGIDQKPFIDVTVNWKS